MGFREVLSPRNWMWNIVCMCICWEKAFKFLSDSQKRTVSPWGRKGSLLCLSIGTQESWNVEHRTGLCFQARTTNRNIWVILVCMLGKLTYKAPVEEGGFVRFWKASVLIDWRASCHAPLSPDDPSWPPPQPWRISQTTGLPSHPWGASFVLLGKMPTVKMQEKQLLIFLLFICVTSCVFLLGFPGTEKWAHSRKWFADGFVLLTGL